MGGGGKVITSLQWEVVATAMTSAIPALLMLIPAILTMNYYLFVPAFLHHSSYQLPTPNILGLDTADPSKLVLFEAQPDANIQITGFQEISLRIKLKA